MRFEIFLNSLDLEIRETFDFEKKCKISRIDNLNNNVVLFKILKSTNKERNCEEKLIKFSTIELRKSLITNKRDIET